jgi:uncharacterized protein (TIGR02453 family)
MEKPKDSSPLTRETFRFLRDLSRNNRKEWMDENRDRYQQQLVAPMRALLDALTPAVLDLGGYVITGRTGVNFSRINRDIRFAKDKTPYHTRLYLTFPDSPDGEGSQLYVGVSPEVVTAGFRIYGGSHFKQSPLAQYAQARARASPQWLAKQKARLARKYQSYWHSLDRGAWVKTAGWPRSEQEWKRVRAWIVRRATKPSAATRRGFVKQVARVFRDLTPLARFCSSPRWRA